MRVAAWAGLQDSVPRAALLAIHARVEDVRPSTWEHASLLQVWGPRFAVYVVAARDRAPFTLGRLADAGRPRGVAEDMAERLDTFLHGRRMRHGDAAQGARVSHPNALRYGAATGRILIRWDGAREPTLWTVPAPRVEPSKARAELARRFLHAVGPGTPASFARWAGMSVVGARAAFTSLARALTPVRTPLGDAWILSADEASFGARPRPTAGVRLLPSGDPYYIVHGSDRALLVADAAARAALWPPRVWPGALLVAGEISGTWRRDGANVTIAPWRRLSRAERDAVAGEAESLPLPEVAGRMRVGWEEAG